MAGSVKDLKVWQEAVLLCGDVVRAVQKGARRETRAFSDALLETALRVTVHIAEGYGQYDPAEQRRVYLQAKRALVELETLLAVARQSGMISPAVLTQLTGRMSGVTRLLLGYLGYLERHMSELGAATPVGTMRGLHGDTPGRVEQVHEVPAGAGV